MKKVKTLIEQNGSNLLYEITSGDQILAYEVTTTKSNSKHKFGLTNADGFFPKTYDYLAYQLYHNNCAASL